MKKFRIQTGKKNAILRALSRPVEMSELANYRELAKQMILYIKNPKNKGVGLAAPQIGINKRIIVVSLLKKYEDTEFDTIVMINPVILTHSPERNVDNEGCLSVIGEEGNVLRWDWITVEYLDIDGNAHVLMLEFLTARIVQHEVDHLDGILFTDRIKEQKNTPTSALFV